jgi:hypothetical protein
MAIPDPPRMLDRVTMDSIEECDYVVAGASSAGCVLEQAQRTKAEAESCAFGMARDDLVVMISILLLGETLTQDPIILENPPNVPGEVSATANVLGVLGSCVPWKDQ